MAPFHSGFVSIVGRPNVGKSTLLNTILGQKIAITSSRPQTTRNRILGVHNLPDAQIVFLDTPGIHRPHDRLGRSMVRAAVTAMTEVDLCLFVVEPRRPGPGDLEIVESLVRAGRPTFLVPNKIDRVPADAVLPVVDAYRGRMDFEEVFPVSALRNRNVDRLVERIRAALPEGPRYYPEEMVTDQLERFMAAEMVRERAMRLTRDEIPHALAVDVDEFRERRNGSVYIRAVIYVERESQKGIIIGKAGRLLKRIGTEARGAIGRLLDAEVYLDLWVKVRADWRERPAMLRGFGYE